MGISVQPEIFGEWRKQNACGEEDWQWVPLTQSSFYRLLVVSRDDDEIKGDACNIDIWYDILACVETWG